MKKILKAAVSLLLAATLSVGTLPAFSPEAGAEGKLSAEVEYTVEGNPVVTITASASENTIVYTTDGSAPEISSLSSFLYTDSLIFNVKTQLRIAEFSPDGKKIKGIKKTVAPRVFVDKAANPEFTLTCKEGSTTVGISCATEGALIYYTTDGTTPTRSSYMYTKEIVLTETSVIKAFAIYQDAKDSEIMTLSAGVAQVGDIAVSRQTPAEQPAEEKPAEQPAEEKPAEQPTEEKPAEKNNTGLPELEPDTREAGKVDAKVHYSISNLKDGGTYITLKYAKSGYTIYYTTDGTAPTMEKGKKYSSRVKFTEPGYMRAYEYNKKGEIVSKILLSVKPSCAIPRMSCVDFSAATRTIVLESDTEGADIYYTIDGSDPEKSKYRTKYEEPFVTGTFGILRVIAVKDGYKKSSELNSQVCDAPCVLKDFNFGDPVFAELAALVNTERRKEGLPALTLDEKLTYAASIRAAEISVYFSHNRLNGKSYTQVYDDVKLNKVVRSTSEMLFHAKTPKDVMNGILSSDGEKDIIMNGNYNSIGVGCYEDGDGNRAWAVIICKLE